MQVILQSLAQMIFCTFACSLRCGEILHQQSLMTIPYTEKKYFVGKRIVYDYKTLETGH